MERAFPFLPDLIELIFERITESGGFQGTRSALGLLGAMLDAMDDGGALMSAAHCKVTSRACTDRLQDLDPTGTLINCAASNQRELAGQPFSEAIASAVLLASLVPGGARGLGRDDLVRHVAAPGADPNRLHAGRDAFSRFGNELPRTRGALLLRLGRRTSTPRSSWKPSSSTTRPPARSWCASGGRTCSATPGTAWCSRTRPRPARRSKPWTASLPATCWRPAGSRRRSATASTRAWSAATRYSCWSRATPGWTIWSIRTCWRWPAASAPRPSSPSRHRARKRRKRFERIARERTQEIVRLLKSAGLVYVRIDEWAEAPDRTIFEEESLGSAGTREEVLTFLRTRIYPGSLFEEHLRDRLDDFFGRRVDQIDRTYRNTLGFPVPLTVDMVSKALVSLAGDPARIAGLQHTRGHFCAEHVSLREPELAAAVLVEPWPASTPRPEPRPPGPEASPEPPPPAGDAVPKPGAVSGEPPSTSEPLGVETEERATPHCRGRGRAAPADGRAARRRR